MKAGDAILDYIFDLQAKVEDLVSPTAYCDFNRPKHNLDSGELLDTLVDLHDSGLVYFLSGSTRVRRKIYQASELDDQWIVSVTKKGGERWESIFRPDWEKYLLIDCAFLENRPLVEVKIEAGCKEVIEIVEMDLQEKIIPSSVSEIVLLHPWNPVYWKTLNEGYSIIFKLPEDLIDGLANEKSKVKWRRNWAVRNDAFVVLPEK